MTAALAAAVLLVVAAPAAARLGADALREVSVAPPVDARVPLSAVLTDENGARRSLGALLGGRPAMLIFADYTCRTLCGPVLAIAAAGLAKTGLAAGRDFSLVVVGLDPKDSAADARAMKRAQVGDGALAAASAFLRGDDGVVPQLASAVGYRYAYDRDGDQYAHPDVVFILTADGRVSRMLPGLGLDAANLRLALVEAGQGTVGTFADRLHLLCYGFDPATGIYSPAILRWLAVASGLAVLALAGAIGLMLMWRPAAPAAPPNAPSERA